MVVASVVVVVLVLAVVVVVAVAVVAVVGKLVVEVVVVIVVVALTVVLRWTVGSSDDCLPCCGSSDNCSLPSLQFHVQLASSITCSLHLHKMMYHSKGL